MNTIFMLDMSSREGRTATTFWMEESIKEEVKRKARELGTTMTDLINHAVDYYISNLTDIDHEAAMKELGKEIKDAPKITQLENELGEIKAKIQSIDKVEDQLHELQEEVTRLKDQMEGEYLRSMVRTHIDAKVGSSMEKLEQIVSKLQQQV